MFSLVTLHVPDFGASLDFYQNTMGMPLVRQFAAGPNTSIAFLGEAAGVQLELIGHTGAGTNNAGSAEAEAPAGFSVGFAVSDITAERDRLLAAGVEMTSDIQQAGPGTKLAFFKGPAGEMVELIEQAQP